MNAEQLSRLGSCLTLMAAAEAIGRSERTLRRWVKDGKIKVTRIGGPRGEIRISVEELAKMIKEDCTDE